jgi:fumarylacetoacetase
MQPTANYLAALPKSEQRQLRDQLQKTLARDDLPTNCKSDISEVTMHLPVDVRGFTDFSCSKEHCLNASQAIMKKRSLPPGFVHFPIGYTGRASSIVVSGTPIIRPKGQFRDGEEVIYGPTKQLDYELEVGCIIGKQTELGETISAENADEHIFGLVLINDWSGENFC